MQSMMQDMHGDKPMMGPGGMMGQGMGMLGVPPDRVIFFRGGRGMGQRTLNILAESEH